MIVCKYKCINKYIYIYNSVLGFRSPTSLYFGIWTLSIVAKVLACRFLSIICVLIYHVNICLNPETSKNFWSKTVSVSLLVVSKNQDFLKIHGHVQTCNLTPFPSFSSFASLFATATK